MTSLVTPPSLSTEPLAVVVVSFGAPELLRDNLATLDLPCPAQLVVVVDNFRSSADRAANAEVAGMCGWTFLPMDTNLGFGAAVNVGAREAFAAGAEHLLVVNPDARLRVNDIAQLQAAATKDPMALVGPRIIRPDGRLWSAGMIVDRRTGDVRSLPPGQALEDAGLDGWLSGACFLISRTLWEHIGGFDEEYFLYWEDVDLSRRCLDAGGRLELVSSAQAVHDVGGTQSDPGARAKSPLYYYYNCRNRLLFAGKHLSGRERWRWILRTPAASWRILLRGGRRQIVDSPAVLIRAIAGAVSGLRLALNRRPHGPTRALDDIQESIPTAAGHVSPAVDHLVTVCFPEGRGVAHWRALGRQFPVPSSWPYGLDQLAVDGAAVDTTDLPELGSVRRRLPAAGFSRRPRHGIALTWDENSAVRMVARPPAKRLFSGVIWATDTAVAGTSNRGLDRQRRALLRTDGLWCLSKPQVDRVQQWLGSQTPPVDYVRFGIDEHFFSPTSIQRRPRIVSFGSDRDRDTATLSAALAIVLESRPDVECLVQTRSDSPLPAGITRLPRLRHDEVRELYQSSSLVAVATRPNWHASGMTVGLEAMATGRPVVACDTPGMSDYFTEGHNAFLVAPQDPEALASRILHLLNDPVRAAEMGEAGRAAVEHSFTTRIMAQRLLEVVR